MYDCPPDQSWGQEKIPCFSQKDLEVLLCLYFCLSKVTAMEKQDGGEMTALDTVQPLLFTLGYSSVYFDTS